MNGSRVEGPSVMRGRRTRVFTRLGRCSVATCHPRGSPLRKSRVPPRQVQRRRLRPRVYTTKEHKSGGDGRAMQPREWAARCSLLALSKKRSTIPKGSRSSLEEKEDDEEEMVEGGRALDLLSTLREIPPTEERIVTQLIVFDGTR